jgi:hypothetical protein
MSAQVARKPERIVAISTTQRRDYGLGLQHCMTEDPPLHVAASATKLACFMLLLALTC